MVDIDGVLCDNIERQRAHLAAGAPMGEHSNLWDDFGDGYLADPAKPEYVALTRHLAVHVILLTCRSRKFRAVTEEWLDLHGVPWDELIMWDPQQHGYYEHKAVAIADVMERYCVQLVIEDSSTHARMFQERGLPVILVPDGLAAH